MKSDFESIIDDGRASVWVVAVALLAFGTLCAIATVLLACADKVIR